MPIHSGLSLTYLILVDIKQFKLISDKNMCIAAVWLLLPQKCGSSHRTVAVRRVGPGIGWEHALLVAKSHHHLMNPVEDQRSYIKVSEWVNLFKEVVAQKSKTQSIWSQFVLIRPRSVSVVLVSVRMPFLCSDNVFQSL